MDEIDVNLRDVAWSPDGAWVTFGAIDSGNEDIWIRRAEGGARIQVTTDEAADIYATWAPDGKSVLWASDRGGHTNLWSKNPFTDEAPQQVTADTDSLAGIGYAISSFSPDGTRIAFTSTKSGNDDIWVRDLRSGVTEQLTSNPHRDVVPGSWSPDGRRIAFSSDRSNPGKAGDIWIIDVDTKMEHRLTSADRWEWNPAWSPDGRFIMYCRGTVSGVALYVTSADGSRTEKVLDLPFYGAFLPRWVPGKPLLSFGGGHFRDGLSLLNPTTNAHTEIPVSDEAVALQLSLSGNRIAAAMFEDSAVVLKEFMVEQAHMQGRVISSFALDQWIEAQMRWHPDEQSLLLKLKIADQRYALTRIDVQNGTVDELIVEKEIGLNRRPWAPSGKRIAYVATYGDQDRDLFTLSLRNLKRRQITFGGVMPEGYDWSPDNRQLVYAGQTPGQIKADLYSVPASRGKAKRLLAWENSTERDPQYSPNGTFVSFVSDRNGANALWLLELESGMVRAVKGGENGSNYLWGRDGSDLTWSRGQGQIFRYELSKDETTKIYRGNTWHRPLGWHTDGRLLLKGGKSGGSNLWLMRAPKLDPHI